MSKLTQEHALSIVSTCGDLARSSQQSMVKTHLQPLESDDRIQEDQCALLEPVKVGNLPTALSSFKQDLYPSSPLGKEQTYRSHSSSDFFVKDPRTPFPAGYGVSGPHLPITDGGAKNLGASVKQIVHGKENRDQVKSAAAQGLTSDQCSLAENLEIKQQYGATLEQSQGIDRVIGVLLNQWTDRDIQIQNQVSQLSDSESLEPEGAARPTAALESQNLQGTKITHGALDKTAARAPISQGHQQSDAPLTSIHAFKSVESRHQEDAAEHFGAKHGTAVGSKLVDLTLLELSALARQASLEHEASALNADSRDAHAAVYAESAPIPLDGPVHGNFKPLRNETTPQDQLANVESQRLGESTFNHVQATRHGLQSHSVYHPQNEQTTFSMQELGSPDNDQFAAESSFLEAEADFDQDAELNADLDTDLKHSHSLVEQVVSLAQEKFERFTQALEPQDASSIASYSYMDLAEADEDETAAFTAQVAPDSLDQHARVAKTEEQKPMFNHVAPLATVNQVANVPVSDDVIQKTAAQRDSLDAVSACLVLMLDECSDQEIASAKEQQQNILADMAAARVALAATSCKREFALNLHDLTVTQSEKPNAEAYQPAQNLEVIESRLSESRLNEPQLSESRLTETRLSESPAAQPAAAEAQEIGNTIKTRGQSRKLYKVIKRKHAVNNGLAPATTLNGRQLGTTTPSQRWLGAAKAWLPRLSKVLPRGTRYTGATSSGRGFAYQSKAVGQSARLDFSEHRSGRHLVRTVWTGHQYGHAWCGFERTKHSIPCVQAATAFYAAFAAASAASATATSAVAAPSTAGAKTAKTELMPASELASMSERKLGPAAAMALSQVHSQYVQDAEQVLAAVAHANAVSAVKAEVAAAIADATHAQLLEQSQAPAVAAGATVASKSQAEPQTSESPWSNVLLKPFVDCKKIFNKLKVQMYKFAPNNLSVFQFVVPEHVGWGAAWSEDVNRRLGGGAQPHRMGMLHPELLRQSLMLNEHMPTDWLSYPGILNLPDLPELMWTLNELEQRILEDYGWEPLHFADFVPCFAAQSALVNVQMDTDLYGSQLGLPAGGFTIEPAFTWFGPVTQPNGFLVAPNQLSVPTMGQSFWGEQSKPVELRKAASAQSAQQPAAPQKAQSAPQREVAFDPDADMLNVARVGQDRSEISKSIFAQASMGMSPLMGMPMLDMTGMSYLEPEQGELLAPQGAMAASATGTSAVSTSTVGTNLEPAAARSVPAKAKATKARRFKRPVHAFKPLLS